MTVRACAACGGHLLAGVVPIEPAEFCPHHPDAGFTERMTGDEARAEVERLRLTLAALADGMARNDPTDLLYGVARSALAGSPTPTHHHRSNHG